MIILPFLFSFIIGWLLLAVLLGKNHDQEFGLRFLLALGLGLGLSSNLTFYGFLLYSRFSPLFTILSHLAILTLIILYQLTIRKKTFNFPNIIILNWQTGLSVVVFLIMSIMAIHAALLYPNGGWDAWQVWNFKARFLFLAGDNWQNLFDPQLWRSSPHYPLLLPLINVWAWIFAPRTLDLAPLITSTIFTLLTTGLLSFSLWSKTRNYFSLLSGLLLISLPFFTLLATSQYCDIVLGFYLLATIVTLAEAWGPQKNLYSLLSGLFCGFMGFTKPEGLIASILICGLAGLVWIYGLLIKKPTLTTANFGHFIFGFVLTSLPGFAFQVLYSPGNQTFINGLTATLKPATAERWQIVLYFFANELIHAKWNGIWILIFSGILLGGKRTWTGKNFIAGAFLIAYLGVILAYYQINTYFEIKWWLSVSLNRILTSLLPLALFWAFSSVVPPKEKNKL